MLLELCFVRLADYCHKEAAFLHDAVGTRERIFADRVEDNIDTFRHVLELLLRIIDCHVRTELSQEILVRRRRRREHFRAARLSNLNCECSYSARSAVNENSLTGAKFGRINQ